MSKNKFVMNSEAVRELLKGQEMQSLLSETASAIQARCGDGYEQDIHVGKNRANAMVWAETIEAKVDNSRNNTILKALK
jgi:phage-related protein